MENQKFLNNLNLKKYVFLFLMTFDIPLYTQYFGRCTGPIFLSKNATMSHILVAEIPYSFAETSVRPEIILRNLKL